MHNDETHALQELGLTLLQTKVYLTLVRLENPTAGETAKLSKVARQEVYRIIEELSELGLVSKIISTPIRFKPLPLSEGISVLLERKIKKTAELQVKIRKLFHKNKNKEVTAHKDYEFRLIPEKAPWFKQIQTQFKTFQTFDLLTSVERFSSRLVHDKGIYRKAMNKGTKIRIITEKPHHKSPILKSVNALKKHQNFEIKYTRTPPQIILIIANQKEAILALSPSNRVGPPYLVSNHPSFIHMAQQYFEKLWNETAEEALPED